MNSDNKSSGIVLIEQAGSPEVLKYQSVVLSQLGPNEVLIAQKAIGVNFLDIFFRNGTFPVSQYPAPVGFEAAGIIEQIGSEVREFKPGDRVAYYATVGS